MNLIYKNYINLIYDFMLLINFEIIEYYNFYISKKLM